MSVSSRCSFKTPFRASLALAIALTLGLPVRGFAAEAAPPSPTATIVVTNCNDSGAGSLRATAAAAVDGSTIDMTQLTCSTITLSSGSIVLALKSLTIQGRGADRLSIKMPPGSHGRNFLFGGYGDGAIHSVSLKGMTIEGGRVVNGFGGCIFSTPQLRLYDSVVRDCQVVGNLTDFPDQNPSGGAIFGFDFVSLTRSKVSDSSVSIDLPDAQGNLKGGGVYAGNGLYMASSTISGNSLSHGGHSYGGGFFSKSSSVYIKNSTISDNSAEYRDDGLGFGGGGFIGRADAGALDNTATILNSTISGNYANPGAAALRSEIGYTILANSTIADNWSSSTNVPTVEIPQNPAIRNLTLRSTIIAQNHEMQTKYELTDLAVGSGVTVSGDHNLIMNSQASPPGTLTANPGLAALTSNGGPTATMALPPGSPAIDRGINMFNQSWDQRGSPFARAVGAAPDIGAFEFSDLIFKNGFERPPP